MSDLSPLCAQERTWIRHFVAHPGPASRPYSFDTARGATRTDRHPTPPLAGHRARRRDVPAHGAW